MKKLLLYLIVIVLSANACNSSSHEKKVLKVHDKHYTEAKTDSEITILKRLVSTREHIYKSAGDTSKLIVWAKVNGKRELVKINRGNFPEGVETTFNLLPDQDGHIIYAAEIPFSESGDWFIMYNSYFTPEGQLFAFERKASFFNGSCNVPAEESFHQLLIKYYNKKFNLIDSVYTLKDDKGKDLTKYSCSFPYEYPYQIYKTLSAYKEANRLPN